MRLLEHIKRRYGRNFHVGQRVRTHGHLGVCLGGDRDVRVRLDGRSGWVSAHPYDVKPIPRGLGRWDAGWPKEDVPFALGEEVVTEDGRGHVCGAFVVDGQAWLWVLLRVDGAKVETPYLASEVVKPPLP